jgi:hypothetical protein
MVGGRADSGMRSPPASSWVSINDSAVHHPLAIPLQCFLAGCGGSRFREGVGKSSVLPVMLDAKGGESQKDGEEVEAVKCQGGTRNTCRAESFQSI